MEITGQQLIPATQERVWQALNDPLILERCLPGCEAIEALSDSEYRITLTATVGPVKAKFKGKLLISDRQPPNSYTIAFDGSGGAAGFARGNARVTLSQHGATTQLDYTAKASLGGKLAQFGSRLIEGVASTLSDKFFTAFNQAVAPATAVATPAPAGTRRPLWIAIGVALAILLLLYLFRAS